MTALTYTVNNVTRNWTDYDYPSLEMVEEPGIRHLLVWIFSLTAIISVLGNLTVVVILSIGKRSSGDLRAFLINLALSDVTMAVFSIPFSYIQFMLGRWLFHPFFCPVVIVMQQVSVIVSVYTLTIIGIDRYNAIMHPFERRLTKLRTKLIITAIWVTAFCITGVQFYVVRAKRFRWDHHEDNWECHEWWEEPQGKHYTVAIFVLTFALPLVALSFTYTSIVCRMWMSNTPGNADVNRDRTQMRAKRKVVKMLVTIVVLFATCWLPLQVFNLLYYFVPGFKLIRTTQERNVRTATYLTCHWLAMANSLVNPLVYCFMSDTFRADLKDLCHPRTRQASSFKSLPHDSARNSSTRTQICLVQRGNSHGSTSSRRWESVTHRDNQMDTPLSRNTPSSSLS